MSLSKPSMLAYFIYVVPHNWMYVTIALNQNNVAGSFSYSFVWTVAILWGFKLGKIGQNLATC